MRPQPSFIYVQIAFMNLVVPSMQVKLQNAADRQIKSIKNFSSRKIKIPGQYLLQREARNQNSST